MLLDRPADGGLFLWGTVPRGVDIDLLVKDAYRNGILLARGAAFSADAAGDPHLRFNVIFAQHVRLAAFLRERLGAVSAAQTAIARAKAPTLR